MENSKPTSLTTPGDSKQAWKPDLTPDLSGDDLANATNRLNQTSFTDKFPMVDRNYADPAIQNQRIGLVSFVPAKGATPNKNGVFGFAKLRGNFQTEEEANAQAEKIIRTTDSTHTIFHAYVGRPFPMTVSDKYAADTSEVDIRKEMTTAVSNSIKEKKEEDKRIAREIEQREKELYDDVDTERDPAAIEEDEYITLRVKKAQLSWTYLEHVKKIKEIKEIIVRTTEQIAKSDAANSDLSASFFTKYVNARQKAGLKNDPEEFRSSFVRYLVEDAVLPGISSEDASVIDVILSEDTPEVAVVGITEQKPVNTD